MAQAAVRAASSSSAAMPLVVRATAQGSLRPTRRRVTNGCSERPACPRKFLDAKKAHSKREFRHTDGNAGTCRGATLSFAARLAGERKMGR